MMVVLHEIRPGFIINPAHLVSLQAATETGGEHDGKPCTQVHLLGAEPFAVSRPIHEVAQGIAEAYNQAAASQRLIKP